MGLNLQFVLLLVFVSMWSFRNSQSQKRHKSEICTRPNLDKCFEKVAPILSEVELIGIPSSKEKVDASCKAFKSGMNCIDEYSRQCFGKKERDLLNDQVDGAKKTFTFLCDDHGFQSEYLQYSGCFRGISTDWDSCARRLMSLLREEARRKNVTQQERIIERCCAKYGFQRCVFTATRIKCGKEEAVFMNRIAETLSSTRVYTSICRNVDTAVCGASQSWSSNGILLPILLIPHLK